MSTSKTYSVAEIKAINKTDHKYCPACKTVKPRNDFYPSRKSRGLCSECKVCVLERSKLWNQENPDKARANRQRRLNDPQCHAQNKMYATKNHLKTRYRIGIEDYARILEEQGGVCAICKLPPRPSSNGKTHRLCVDHCHETNAVRGLLCKCCNWMIGHAQENADILASGIKYIEEYKYKHRGIWVEF